MALVTAQSLSPAEWNARLMVVMGVSGCGKSSVGQGLADALGGHFHDGDSYHPAANIEKMSRGEPLTDADRWPWLESLARGLAAEAGIAIGGCSALRRAYRDRIRATAGEPVLFIHLAGSKELIWSRMAVRKDHFMPVSLLDSQFATLETPQPDEPVLSVDIAAPVPDLVKAIAAALGR